MLSKLNRLRKDRDIQRVFKAGRGHREDFIFLKLIENGLKESRFAFVVGQKVAKKAVIRNKIKRRLRELAGASLPAIRPGLDIVMVAQKGLEVKNFKELAEIMDKLFKKAKLWVF